MTPTPLPPETIQAGLARLEAAIARHPSALVAFSGGVDSALLAVVAKRVLGDRALAVTAASPSLPPRELQAASAFAKRHGLQHRVIQTEELDNPAYAANPANRCYFCKDELFTKLDDLARAEGFDAVMDGFNADDRSDYRPGHQAAREHATVSPLAEAELGKDMVRAIARQLGLEVWDKPAAACLSSRIPYGSPVTDAALATIDAAEVVLLGLGFTSCRVRHHGELARVEVPANELDYAFAQRAAIVEGLKAAGYLYVTLDLEGYRLGSLNAALGLGAKPAGSL